MQLNQSFKHLWLITIFIALFSNSIVTGQEPAGNGSKAVLLTSGARAPACQLKGIDNQNYSFPEPGCWNMIFFWSLFCHSCIEEMPAVQERLASQKSEKFRSFFIALDSEKMQKALINFCKKRELKQPVLMEQLASGSYFAADRWGVSMTPSVFIVAPDGKIAYSHQGPMDIEKFFADFAEMSASESSITNTEK